MTVKSPMLLGALAVTSLMSDTSFSRNAQRPRGADRPRAAQPRTRNTARQRTESGHTRRDSWTDDGFTRSTTAANARGETATRDLTVVRDKNSDTVVRKPNYTTFGGREGVKSDVIQRTEDGYSRDVTRLTPDGATHTRSVDVSCDQDVGKCVKQVEVGQQP